MRAAAVRKTVFGPGLVCPVGYGKYLFKNKYINSCEAEA